MPETACTEKIFPNDDSQIDEDITNPKAKNISEKRKQSDVDREKELSEKPAQQAITEDGQMPQKKFYRSRAHCNPLAYNDSFDYPIHPNLINWCIDHYPSLKKVGEETSIAPNVLDIGCGFGGLTVTLATLLPTKVILGLEIRAKVAEYVRLRILACRRDHPGKFENCSVMRSNTMKFMPNLFRKESLEKIFLCFPDPHFKKKNHPRRIVSERLLSEYAHFLKSGMGRLYTITDVEDLHKWHLQHCRAHPMFRELTEDELEDDPCVKAMYNETEEGKKVERGGAKKYYAVYEKIKKNDSSILKRVGAENFFNDGEFGVKKTVLKANNVTDP